MTKKTSEIILLINTSRKSGSGLVRGIAKYSHAYGPWIFHKQPPFYLTSERSRNKFIKNLKNLNADGIILLEETRLDEIKKLGLPTIASLVTNKNVPGIVRMLSDDHKVGRMAAEHFLERGFKRFGFAGYPDLFWSEQRKEGFLNSLKKEGYSASVYEPDSKNMSWEKERSDISRWIKGLEKPAGILTCNDDRGEQILEICRKEDTNVPEEVSVIGVDNDSLICDLAHPPLSSIGLDFEKAGFESAAILDEMIKGKKPSKEIITVEPTFAVTRQSTDILAIEDEEVVRALKYIKDSPKKPIQVSDVVEELAISRRALEMRFKKSLNRTINQEIRRHRTIMIAKKLIDTDKTITKIAFEMEFNNVAHMARFFRQNMGLSPMEYRKKHSKNL